MIILSILRIIGMKYQGKLDTIWENFFVVLAAEVGLTLVATTSFRVLFVTKMKERRDRRLTGSSTAYKRSKEIPLHSARDLSGRSGIVHHDQQAMPLHHNGVLLNQRSRVTMTSIRRLIRKDSPCQTSINAYESIAEGGNLFGPFPARTYHSLQNAQDEISTDFEETMSSKP
jgi:hypothetical protein